MKLGTQTNEQLEKPQHRAQSKKCVETHILIGPMKLRCPQKGDDSAPPTQSTSNNRVPYSILQSHASKTNSSYKIMKSTVSGLPQ